MISNILHFFISGLLCLVLSDGYAQKGILESESARFSAMMNRDTIALQRLISTELIYVHSNGLVESKADFIHSVGSGKIVYSTMVSASNQVVHWNRTATINGIIQVKGVSHGNPFDIKLRYLSVYKKERRVWKLIRWQSLKV